MVKLNTKLKGTTLVETLVSMVLIVLLMVIVTKSLVQADRETGTNIKPYAAFLVKNSLENPPPGETTIEVTDEYSNLMITKTLTKYKTSDSLFVFEVTATNSDNQIIAKARRIISSNAIEKQKGNEE
jgi:hypothetical protein